MEDVEKIKGAFLADAASSNSSWADQESTVYSVDALLEEIDEMIPPSLKEEARHHHDHAVGVRRAVVVEQGIAPSDPRCEHVHQAGFEEELRGKAFRPAPSIKGQQETVYCQDVVLLADALEVVERLEAVLLRAVDKLQAWVDQDECDCTMDGGVHMCGLPDIQRIIADGRAALASDEKGE